MLTLGLYLFLGFGLVSVILAFIIIHLFIGGMARETRNTCPNCTYKDPNDREWWKISKPCKNCGSRRFLWTRRYLYPFEQLIVLIMMVCCALTSAITVSQARLLWFSSLNTFSVALLTTPVPVTTTVVPTTSFASLTPTSKIVVAPSSTPTAVLYIPPTSTPTKTYTLTFTPTMTPTATSSNTPLPPLPSVETSSCTIRTVPNTAIAKIYDQASSESTPIAVIDNKTSVIGAIYDSQNSMLWLRTRQSTQSAEGWSAFKNTALGGDCSAIPVWAPDRFGRLAQSTTDFTLPDRINLNIFGQYTKFLVAALKNQHVVVSCGNNCRVSLGTPNGQALALSLGGGIDLYVPDKGNYLLIVEILNNVNTPISIDILVEG